MFICDAVGFTYNFGLALEFNNKTYYLTNQDDSATTKISNIKTTQGIKQQEFLITLRDKCARLSSNLWFTHVKH